MGITADVERRIGSRTKENKFFCDFREEAVENSGFGDNKKSTVTRGALVSMEVDFEEQMFYWKIAKNKAGVEQIWSCPLNGYSSGVPLSPFVELSRNATIRLLPQEDLWEHDLQINVGFDRQLLNVVPNGQQALTNLEMKVDEAIREAETREGDEQACWIPGL